MKGTELLEFLQKLSPEALENAYVYFNAPEKYLKLSNISFDNLGDIILSE